MAFTSLAAGVSGLQSFSEAVGVIADNITNVNTVGYKESRSRFSTLVTETAAISSYSPGGVTSSTETLVSKQGLLQPTNKSTDLSVDGNGFFIVRQEADNDSEIQYTRAGSFSPDETGFLKNSAGLFLMGWELEGGEPPVNKSQAANLVPINLANQTGEAEATSKVTMDGNLNASATVKTYPGVGSIADGSYTIGEDDLEQDYTVYDQQGIAHVFKMTAVKTDVNEWSYEIYSDDAASVDATLHPDGLLASGILSFSDSGQITTASSSMIDSSGGGSIYNTTNGIGSVPVTFSAANGIGSGPITVDFGFGDGTGSQGLSQTSGSSGIVSSSSDGGAFGSVVGVAIGDNGDVTTLFDSGSSLTSYRLPIATFNNADGLLRRQGNSYSRSDVSGEGVFKEAGQKGAGKISSNTLELSTVDLASEFAELIKVQRAFSASTRIISTSDEILEELTRL